MKAGLLIAAFFWIGVFFLAGPSLTAAIVIAFWFASIIGGVVWSRHSRSKSAADELREIEEDDEIDLTLRWMNFHDPRREAIR